MYICVAGMFLFSISSSGKDSIPSIVVGSPEIPGDPVYTKYYNDTFIYGQVLEPLFGFGDDGQIKGVLAKSWKFASDRKVLDVDLADDHFFSNGQRLTSEDVKFSIDRHRLSHSTLGAAYLSDIQKIEIKGTFQLRIVFSRPNVAILRVLCRQSFGILPKSWKFDRVSLEPFVGSGAYRFIKDGNDWFFVRNDKYLLTESNRIPKWRVEFNNYLRGSKADLRGNEVGDMIILTQKRLSMLFDRLPILSKSHTCYSKGVYVQGAYWWVGNSLNTFSKSEKVILSRQLEKINLLVSKIAKIEFSRSFFPQGMLGFDQVPIDNGHRVSAGKKISIRVDEFDYALLKKIQDESPSLFTSPFKLQILKYELYAKSPGKQVERVHLDLVNSLPGFIDPEGYVGAIPSLLESSAKQVYGTKVLNLSIEGLQEFDGSKRAIIYRNINHELVKNVRMIPAWSDPLVECVSNRISRSSKPIRYGTNLLDYSRM